MSVGNGKEQGKKKGGGEMVAIRTVCVLKKRNQTVLRGKSDKGESGGGFVAPRAECVRCGRGKGEPGQVKN